MERLRVIVHRSTAVAMMAAALLSASSCSIFRHKKTEPITQESGSGYTYSYNPSWGRGGGISTARPPQSQRDNPYRNRTEEDASTPEATDTNRSSSMTDDLLSYAKSFLGTPYKYGTSGPSSFDCSGFTTRVFGEFGISLERSSAGQALKGEEIFSKDDLEPGDLVFFARSGRVFHVGIVLEKTGAESFNFIHASTSAGVTITSSESSYWKPKYYSARRMF